MCVLYLIVENSFDQGGCLQERSFFSSKEDMDNYSKDKNVIFFGNYDKYIIQDCYDDFLVIDKITKKVIRDSKNYLPQWEACFIIDMNEKDEDGRVAYQISRT